METIELQIGSFNRPSNAVSDTRRPVEFVGERLAEHSETGISDRPLTLDEALS